MDPGHEHLAADLAPSETKQARRLRTNRFILLGAWMLTHYETHRKLSTLVSNDLAGFLAQGKHVRENEDLLKDMLGK